MVQRMGLRWAVLGALIATAACSSSTPKAGNSVPTAAATTTTTDPYAIPATIDVAYVQRVMDAIDPLLGKAAQALVREKSVTGEWAKYARAALDDKGLASAKYGAQLELGVNLRDVKPTPGQPRTTVQAIVASGPSCVAARAFRDSSELTTLPHSSGDSNIELRLVQEAWDPENLNPTPWVVSNVSDITAKNVQLCDV
ncbi:MAG: hypothetical protein JWO37_309 [Acidimicrobiales bacterium]|jgi:hypothetical protein|nr:hypothetical protein [Acidimicrobiales bacterium]